MPDNDLINYAKNIVNRSENIDLNWIEFAWRKFNDKILFEHIPSKEEFEMNNTMYEIFQKFKDKNTINTTINNYKKKYKVSNKIAVRDITNTIGHFITVGLIKSTDLDKKITTIYDKNYKNHGKYDFVTRNKLAEFFRNEFPYCPFSVEFDLTYMCNAKCIHCMYCDTEINENEELSFNEISNILEQLAKNGTFIVSYSGGEVTLRKDFLPIIIRSRELGFHVTFLSNGIILGQNTELLEEIVNQIPASVSIILHGSTSETHDGFTRIKGSFNNAIKTIEFLTDKNIQVEVRSSITKKNYSEFQNIAELCKKLNVKFFAGLYILPTVTGNIKTTKLNLRKTKLKEMLKLNYEIYNKEELTVPTKICNAGNSRVCISPTGEVQPCNTLKLSAGSIRNDSFENIWYKSGFFKLLRNIKMIIFIYVRIVSIHLVVPPFVLELIIYGIKIFSPP